MRLTRRSIAQLLDQSQEPTHRRVDTNIESMALLAMLIERGDPVFIRHRFTTVDQLKTHTYGALSRLVARRVVYLAIANQEQDHGTDPIRRAAVQQVERRDH